MSQDMVKSVVKSLTAAAQSKESFAEWLDCPTTTPDVNEFVVFLKPEATDFAKSIDVEAVTKVALDALDKFGVKIHDVRVMNGKFLAEHQMMDGHYGVINRISRQGLQALTPEVQAKVTEMAEGDKNVVFGAHQLMAIRPALSAEALSVLSDSVGTTKLGGGTYAIPAKVDGKRVVILSPFHPYQLEHFTDFGKTIACFKCSSSRSWKELRNNLVGATNPLKAEAGSVRRQFLERKDELRLPDVSQGMNGLHLSAGPLEGMVECMRFFARHDGSALQYEDTAFGKMLAKAGYSRQAIDDLAQNPTLDIAPELRDQVGGKAVISAFDATEETDAVDAVVLFDKVLPQQAQAANC